MAVGEIVNGSSELIVQLGEVAMWLQALGIILILWLVFQVVNLILNWKRRKLLLKIERQVDNLERKLVKKKR